MKKTYLKVLIGFIFLFTLSSAYAQNKINYLEIKDSVIFYSCSSVNSENVKKSAELLSKIDESQISSGLAEYYYDYGVTLNLYGIFFSKDTTILEKSTEYFLKCIEIAKIEIQANAYDFIVWNYLNLNDCQNAKKYFDIYMEVEKEEFINEDLVLYIARKCGE